MDTASDGQKLGTDKGRHCYHGMPAPNIGREKLVVVVNDAP